MSFLTSIHRLQTKASLRVLYHVSINRRRYELVMEDAIHQFRQQISMCWDDATISPKFLPRKPDQPIAAGQCTATSYVLSRHLQSLYKKQSFVILVGEVWHKGHKVIPYHVWVVSQDLHNPSDSRIIDITADQSRVLPKVIISSARTLARDGTAYIAYTPIEDLRLLGGAAQKRAELLEQKYRRVT